MLLLAMIVFIEWLGLEEEGLFSPSGARAGGVGMLMIAVVI